MPRIRKASTQGPAKNQACSVRSFTWVKTILFHALYALIFRPTHILKPWETKELEEFLLSRRLMYAKIYDATNRLYFYINAEGYLTLTADCREGDEALWTISGDRCIENKATGIAYVACTLIFS